MVEAQENIMALKEMNVIREGTIGKAFRERGDKDVFSFISITDLSKVEDMGFVFFILLHIL